MDIIGRLKVLRSKNAGPFVITFDVVFGEAEDYETVKQRLGEENIAAAFRVNKKDVLSFGFFDELKAAKISLRRRQTCGHPGDSDCYGMNQEEPLAGLLRELVPN
ncbi:MAG: DUF4387 domain-containing protein [Nitrospinota bacterium]